MENWEEESFANLYEQSVKDVKLGKIVTGKIIEITSKGEIFVDLGYKADGLIPKKEYSFDEEADPNKEFKVGDSITADVLKLNDGLGNVLLSYKRVKNRNSRKEFEEKVNNKEIFEEVITQVTDKGFVTQYQGIRIFIPLSLSGITRDQDIKSYLEKMVRFRIKEYTDRKVIGSVIDVVDEDRKQKQDAFWNSVKIGDTYEGQVANMNSYGAFIDLGPIQGLLHISEIAWNKNANPADYLKVGQTIKVIIKDIDAENKRLVLSYTEKGANPWDTIADKYNINDIVKVKIVKLMPFGAFAELEEGIDGLIHISQIAEKRVMKPEEILKVGQLANAKIIGFDKEKQKIELSLKELEGTSNEYLEEIE